MSGEQTVVVLLGLDDGTTALGLSKADSYLYKGALALSTSVHGQVTTTDDVGDAVDFEPIDNEKSPIGKP